MTPLSYHSSNLSLIVLETMRLLALIVIGLTHFMLQSLSLPPENLGKHLVF